MRPAPARPGPGLLVPAIALALAAAAWSGPLARLEASMTIGLFPILSRPFQDPAAEAARTIARTLAPTPALSRALRGFLGRRLRAPQAVLTLILLALLARRDPDRRFRRRLDMWSLLRISAGNFKCLAPIVKCGPITARESLSGEWAIAKTPLQFALEEGLLKNVSGRALGVWEILDKRTGLPFEPPPDPDEGFFRLDEARLMEVLAGQLGGVLPGDPRRLPDHQRGLAAAFLAHWRDDKDAAMRIFDSLSESWTPSPEPRREAASGKKPLRRLWRRWAEPAPGLREGAEPAEGLGEGAEPAEGLGEGAKPAQGLDLREADRYLGALTGPEAGPAELARLAGHASFVNVWLMGLLGLARTRGVLPSSMWIWLKPVDRTLFYALNQVGGRTAWAEAAGVWSHLEAERAAGTILLDPVVGPAAEALANSLADEGWLERPGAPKGAGPASGGPASGEGPVSGGPAAGARDVDDPYDPDNPDDPGDPEDPVEPDDPDVPDYGRIPDDSPAPSASGAPAGERSGHGREPSAGTEARRAPDAGGDGQPLDHGRPEEARASGGPGVADGGRDRAGDPPGHGRRGDGQGVDGHNPVGPEGRPERGSPPARPAGPGPAEAGQALDRHASGGTRGGDPGRGEGIAQDAGIAGDPETAQDRGITKDSGFPQDSGNLRAPGAAQGPGFAQDRGFPEDLECGQTLGIVGDPGPTQDPGSPQDTEFAGEIGAAVSRDRGAGARSGAGAGTGAGEGPEAPLIASGDFRPPPPLMDEDGSFEGEDLVINLDQLVELLADAEAEDSS